MKDRRGSLIFSECHYRKPAKGPRFPKIYP